MAPKVPSQSVLVRGSHAPASEPALREGPLARTRRRDAADFARFAMWIAFPLAGVVWTATRYASNYPYYDEWAMIERTTGGWGGIVDGHLGHLMIWNYLVYRAQRVLFGLEGHELIYAGLLASVATLQVSMALLLRRLGLPALLALLAATMLVFFGPGGQNTQWEFNQNLNLALALCFFAGFLAVGNTRTRRVAVSIAILLVAAVACDSGLAILGSVFVGILLVMLWPRRQALIALVPSVVANGLWFFLGKPGPDIGASWDAMLNFASKLFTLSAAGLVGGADLPASSIGSRNHPPAIPLSSVATGVIVVVVALACVAFGVSRHRLSRPVVAGTVAGVVAAVLCVAALAKTRAFLITPEMFPGSRYVQWVSAFLLVGFAPAIAAALRPSTPRRQRVSTSIAALALVVVFLLNLGAFNASVQYNKEWSTRVERSVKETVRVLTVGCGEGQRITDGFPEPALSPQITVGLIQVLLADGALTPSFGTRATRARRALICT